MDFPSTVHTCDTTLTTGLVSINNCQQGECGVRYINCCGASSHQTYICYEGYFRYYEDDDRQ